MAVPHVELVAVLSEEHVTGARYRDMNTKEEFDIPCEMVFLGTSEHLGARRLRLR